MIIHVLPNEKGHLQSNRCKCNPSVLRVYGSVIIIHNLFGQKQAIENLIENINLN
jgi:hypothetical protein